MYVCVTGSFKIDNLDTVPVIFVGTSDDVVSITTRQCLETCHTRMSLVLFQAYYF